MPNIGATELIVILVIVLLIFGPKRLPSLGRQLGSGMREFKDSITGGDAPDSDAADRPALSASRPPDADGGATPPEREAAPADAAEPRA